MMETPAGQKKSSNTVAEVPVAQTGAGAPEGSETEHADKLSVVDYKMVTFSLAGKDYAIDIMKVKEIAKAGRFTYVPNTLPYVLGVYNLRGEIIPIIDLRLFFNIEVPERKNDALENMLIVSVGEQTFGIVVDVIDKVVGIQKAMIQPPHPLFGDINIKYIQGVIESNNRLYILLDVERIFGSKSITEAKDAGAVKQVYVQKTFTADTRSPVAELKTDDKKSAAAPAQKNADIDYTFIIDGLASMRKFFVTPLNEQWMKARYAEWSKERGKDRSQLQTAADADDFLKTFYSPFTAAWWSKEYADAVYKTLPDNSAKQIIVWNPGCGKGCETYSLACLLNKRYPEAKIRIYAHDIDLLSVSNAPLMSIPAETANSWYAPYVTKKANGDFTFTSEIRDSIMFEYHDCQNTNALPVVDIVFARDVLSFQNAQVQNTIFTDFEEKLKGNGIILLGEHETLEGRSKWKALTEGSIVVYGKQ
jgi:chemotaxis signal transduction protein/chemotaxis methyl-accepting protein methylase